MNKHPQQYKQWQLARLASGDKRVRLTPPAKTPSATEGNLTDQQNQPQLGRLYAMTDNQHAQLINMLKAAQWPVSKRYKVPGHGCCLGATGDNDKGYLHPRNSEHSGLIKAVNKSIKQALGSLQHTRSS